MAITQNTATKKPISIAIQSNVAKKLRITITPSYRLPRTFGNNQGQSVVLLVGQIALERIMTKLAQIGLATALLVGGATFAMAQNGPPTPPGYPGAAQNPNLYGHRYHLTMATITTVITMPITPTTIIVTTIGTISA